MKVSCRIQDYVSVQNCKCVHNRGLGYVGECMIEVGVE